MTLNKLILVAALGGLMSPMTIAATAAESAAAAANSAAAAAKSANEAAAHAADAAKHAAAAKGAVPATATSVAASDAPQGGPQYVVVDGKVDKATFNGYRRFHGTCHACHGQDAAGGSFAPSLVESLKSIDYAMFTKTVLEGRQTTSSGGGTNAMPAFANDPNITKYLDDIYAYVKARSDGVLGTGRPPKLPKPK